MWSKKIVLTLIVTFTFTITFDSNIHSLFSSQYEACTRKHTHKSTQTHTLSHSHLRGDADLLPPFAHAHSGRRDSGFVFGGSGCQPGLQQALQTPQHRLIICHLCVFLFFLLLMWIFVFKCSSDQFSVLLLVFESRSHHTLSQTTSSQLFTP